MRRLGALALLLLVAAAAAAVTEPFVNVGFVSFSDARIRVQTGRAGSKVEVHAVGLQSDAVARCVTGDVTTTDGSCVAVLTGLREGTEYALRVDVDAYQIVGQFRTLARGSGSFAFGSCAHQVGATHGVFDAIAEQSPDLFLSLGDFIYADLSPNPLPTNDLTHPKFGPALDPAFFMAKHRAAMSAPGLARLALTVPMAGTWDDHEFEDNVDSSHPKVTQAVAATAFAAYVGALAPPHRDKSRLGFFMNFTIGTADVVVLDSRSFRDPYLSPDTATKSMLGAAQRTALNAWIAQSTAPFRVVISSVLFNPCSEHALDPRGGPLLDSWWRYPSERAAVLAAIASSKKPTLLLSADSHWPSATRITGDALGVPVALREVSVSPLDAFALPPPSRTECASPDGLRATIDFKAGPAAWPSSATDNDVVSYYGLVSANADELTVAIRRVTRGVDAVVWEERMSAAGKADESTAEQDEL